MLNKTECCSVGAKITAFKNVKQKQFFVCLKAGGRVLAKTTALKGAPPSSSKTNAPICLRQQMCRSPRAAPKSSRTPREARLCAIIRIGGISVAGTPRASGLPPRGLGPRNRRPPRPRRGRRRSSPSSAFSGVPFAPRPGGTAFTYLHRQFREMVYFGVAEPSSLT